MRSGGAIAFPIPGTPTTGSLVEYQAALVERARTMLLLRAGGDDAVRERARRAQAGLADARRGHVFPLEQMADALGLDDLDRDALGLIAGVHLDPSLRDDVRRFRRDRSRGWVDAALILELYTGGPEHALSLAPRFRRHGVLAEAGLVEHAAPRVAHAPSELELELVPTPRLLGLLSGQVVIDPRLRDAAALSRPRPGDVDGILTDLEAARLAETARAACGTAAGRRPGRLCVEGPEGIGKTAVASAIAGAAGFDFVLVVQVPLLPCDGAEMAARFHLLTREARLFNALLVLRHLHEAGERAAPLRCLIERTGAPLVGTSRGEEHALPSGTNKIAVRRPDRALRRRAWETELSRRGVRLADDELARLATDLPLARPGVARAVAVGGAAPRELERAARAQLVGGLARYAVRTSSGARLADLVLPADQREAIVEIIQAYRHRPSVLAALGDRGAGLGKGTVALFNGPPGTGKTFSASVIANELDLALYRIDVSSIVDRYVGETEKNLTRVFEEAAGDGAALLFDEADSLFAKRVEVKDSTDRYANMQVNLLLNLIEDYEGLVIMTTNLKGALDRALLRRVAYKVQFDLPEVEERLALWRRHLEGLAVDDSVSLQTIAAKFTVAGGEIKNAVTRAVLSAGPGVPVSDEHLRRAICSELTSRGSVVSD